MSSDNLAPQLADALRFMVKWARDGGDPPLACIGFDSLLAQFDATNSARVCVRCGATSDQRAEPICNDNGMCGAHSWADREVAAAREP